MIFRFIDVMCPIIISPVWIKTIPSSKVYILRGGSDFEIPSGRKLEHCKSKEPEMYVYLRFVMNYVFSPVKDGYILPDSLIFQRTVWPHF
jgi:hypothetical protein